METKKFISTLKGYRTRFTSKPDETLEKKMVEGLAEKFGGKLNVIATLKEQNLDDLKDYFKGVIGLTVPKKENTENPEQKIGKELLTNEDGQKFASVNGKTYKIDTVKKTLKRVYNDFSDIDITEIDLPEMPMTVYQNYLRDTFNEDAPIKKGKLHFRGYRISCDSESGFIIEDTTKRYAIVETPFEGIPTPKELGEFFNRPVAKLTPKQMGEAAKLGKELKEKALEKTKKETAEEEPEVDYEKARRKVLRTIKNIRSKTVDFDPLTFPEMIPFKRWKRKVNSLISKWKERKFRYAKLLDEIEKATVEETFEVTEKPHRNPFNGTALPEHKTVGLLVGDKIEVDGKWIDAVPFLLEYLLHHEPRVMPQIMKYANGEITCAELLKDPYEKDWRVEYNPRALKNSAHNARVLSIVFEMAGVIAPQDLLFEADLQAGDKISLCIDGKMCTRTIASTEKGITVGRNVGIYKLDKWIKL